MFNKYYIVKLLIIALIIVYCESYTQLQKNFMLLQKPGNCFCPNHCKHCDNGNPNLPNTKARFWFFHPGYKVCRPYYVNDENKNCCNTRLTNVLRTRKECEDLCGEPCIVTHPNYKTEPGICMETCHINDPDGVPLACQIPKGKENYEVVPRCCPRGYQYPLLTSEVPNEHVFGYQQEDFYNNNTGP